MEKRGVNEERRKRKRNGWRRIEEKRTEKEGMDNGCRKGEGVEWKKKGGEKRRR